MSADDESPAFKKVEQLGIQRYPTQAHAQWAAVGSIGQIKGWLKEFMAPELHMCLMAQLDAIYLSLVDLGLNESITATGNRKVMTRDGEVLKYVLAVNYIHDDKPWEYFILMTPDETGRVVSFSTQHGTPTVNVHAQTT